jgi:nitric oxide reductase NorD protein
MEETEQGIHSFCITIDTEAQTYLPHIYGEAKYTLIDNVKKLPSKIYGNIPRAYRVRDP